MGVRDGTARVAICGSYGGMNLGDEAILQVILRELRGSRPVDATVFSRDPGDTAQRLGVRAVGLSGISRQAAQGALGEHDLFILGGGGLLYDADSEMYLRILATACDMGIPAMTYAISAGPLHGTRVRARVREVLNRAQLLTDRRDLNQRIQRGLRELQDRARVTHRLALELLERGTRAGD